MTRHGRPSGILALEGGKEVRLIGAACFRGWLGRFDLVARPPGLRRSSRRQRSALGLGNTARVPFIKQHDEHPGSAHGPIARNRVHAVHDGPRRPKVPQVVPFDVAALAIGIGERGGTSRPWHDGSEIVINHGYSKPAWMWPKL